MKLDREQIKALLPSSGKGSWFEIKNLADDGAAEVRIYDEISLWGITAEDFVNEIDALDVENIVCRINCPGGSVFDGIAIHNSLRAHRASVTTIVDGIAASAASFIAQAGDERIMMRHSQMMIHNAQGVAVGDASTMRQMADLLDKQNDVIAGIYAERAESKDKDVAYFKDLMTNTTWMTDQEAVDNGLADEVVTPERKGDQAENTLGSDAERDKTERVDWSALFADTVASAQEELYA